MPAQHLRITSPSSFFSSELHSGQFVGIENDLILPGLLDLITLTTSGTTSPALLIKTKSFI